MSEQEFDDEQALVARTVHLVQHADAATQYAILQKFIVRFMKGDVKRMKFTVPASCFALFRIVHLVYQQGVASGMYRARHSPIGELSFGVLFQQIKSLIELIQSNYAELAIKLYLNFVLCINEVDSEKQFDDFTYDLGAQAISLFQDEIGDSNVKYQVIHLIIATFSRISCISAENHDTLASNATSQASKLLKKNEQCVAILQATHMFYNDHSGVTMHTD